MTYLTVSKLTMSESLRLIVNECADHLLRFISRAFGAI